jgi:hypothetical protein
MLMEAALRDRGYHPLRLKGSAMLEETKCQKIAKLKAAGKPACCDLVMDLFQAKVAEAVAGGVDAFVTDGIPRFTTKQADGLAAIAGRNGYVMRLRATRQLCELRIRRRVEEMLAANETPRPDDMDPEAVRNRLDAFDSSAPFLIRRLTTLHGFRIITATASDDLTPEEVHQQFVRQLWGRPSHIEDEEFATIGSFQRDLAAA